MPDRDQVPVAASQPGAATAAARSPLTTAIGNFRWTICGLLFFAATVNYIDRQVLSLLKPLLQSQLGWAKPDVAYGDIVTAFQFAYAAGPIFAGRLMDWMGTRKGFTLSVFVWSVAAMAHAAVRTVFGFECARAALGVGESGSFPASIKTVAEWFPKKERALATGIFNSGTNVGAIVVPLFVPWLTMRYGWQAAFIWTGAVGFLWIVAWLAIYRRPEDHPRLKPSELAYIRSDPPESITPIRWVKVVPHRQTWAFAVGKFLTDPIWWVYLFWVPDFLTRVFHVKLMQMMIPVAAIYTMATVGGVYGGHLSSSLLKRGWTANAARKTAMLICAVAVTPIIYATRVQNMWAAVVIIGIACAAHQGFSANIFTITSDVFPRRAVGSVVGIGQMTGALGGMIIAQVVGHILEWTGSYVTVFLIAGSAYLIALGIMHAISPKLEPVTDLD